MRSISLALEADKNERTLTSLARIPHDDTLGSSIQMPSDKNEQKWKKRLKIIIPHLCLFGLTLGYSLVGAVIFSNVEGGDPSTPKRASGKEGALMELEKYKQDIVDKLWTFGKSQKGGTLQDLMNKEEEFMKFAAKIETLHSGGLLSAEDVRRRTSPRHRLPELSQDSETDLNESRTPWTFGSAIFFVVTTLTTIGYGNVVPSTSSSRGLCIAFCIIGIPLYLITTANLAKFLGVGVTALYVKYIELKHKICDIIRYIRTGEETVLPSREDIDEMAELLYREIENAQVVNVSAWVVYSIIISYALFGGLIFSWMEPGWTFFDGFYFSFISILKVGFGEILPTGAGSMAMTLFYSFFGLVITTMCVDVAGGRYLDQLHEFGRIKKPTYLDCLKRSHYLQKRRKALASLHNTVTAVRHLQVSESLTTIESEAPMTPEDVRVTEITPYSMKLSWAPPIATSSSTKYLLKYKMKNEPIPFIDDTDPLVDDSHDRSFGNKSRWFFQLTRGENSVVIKDIKCGQCEIKNLKSFSIYEMSLRAFNDKGNSAEKRMVHITEPASAPQDLHVDLLDMTSVRLTWGHPYAKRRDVEGYTIYYTTEASHEFEHWGKVVVGDRDTSVVLMELEANVKYTMCMCSRYNKGHSPISRSISIYTGEVNSNTVSTASTQSSMPNVNDECL